MNAATIILDDEAVEEILRLRDVYETPWEQLAQDEGCDPNALREAVQEWEAGKGGVVIASILPSSQEARKQAPTRSRERARENKRRSRARLRDLMQEAGLSEGEARAVLQAERDAAATEKAQRREGYRQRVQDLLGGIDVHSPPGSCKTQEQREALYRIAATLRAEGATLADFTYAVDYSYEGGWHCVRAAYYGQERQRPPKGGGIKGEVLQALRGEVNVVCAACLARRMGHPRVTVGNALSGLAERNGSATKARPCAECGSRHGWRAT